MIRYLHGILAAKEEGMVVIDVNGLGYEVNMPTNSAIFLREVGEEVKVYTVLQVREDDMSLFGFMTEGELDLYRKLITVNSVGAKNALAILSAMPLSEIKKAIVFEDVAMITRANGIGKKTAQKIVLELKDKIEGVSPADDIGAVSGAAAPPAPSGERENAVEALINLGYTRTEALTLLVGADGGMEVEDYIKYALKNRG